MEFLTAYQQLLDASLISANKDKAPQGLYAPIDYLLSLGGKRLRPILVLEPNTFIFNVYFPQDVVDVLESRE
jgi:geranylgeranyl diphosphate synthase type II